MGINDFSSRHYSGSPTTELQHSLPPCQGVAAPDVSSSAHTSTSASSILASLKSDAPTQTESSSPPLLPSTLLYSLKDSSRSSTPIPHDSHSNRISLSPPSSPPLSPIPKTSSILMSLKNSLNSSTSSLNYISPMPSPFPSPCVSRSPSPTFTPNSTPPSSPYMSSFGAYGTISPPPSPSNTSTTCFVPNCLVCTRGAPPNVLKTPTWSSIMRVVFYALQRGFPDKLFFNLRTDVYVFMTRHWNKLCPSKDAKHNWKKQIQDMLSHSKNMFESGTGFYKQNGFWRLKKPLTDPWSQPKPDFHHRAPHRSSSSSSSSSIKRECRHSSAPPAKRARCEIRDDDLHIPPLTVHKGVIRAFHGLQGEMGQLKEVLLALRSRDLPRDERANPESFCPSFSPLAYQWESSRTDVFHRQGGPVWDQLPLFCNNVLPPIHHSSSKFSASFPHPFPYLGQQPFFHFRQPPTLQL